MVSDPLNQVASWPATAAAGVTSPGAVASAGPADQPFAWASVTKLLTVLAALDGVQRGLLDLDEPGAAGSTPTAASRSSPTDWPRGTADRLTGCWPSRFACRWA